MHIQRGEVNLILVLKQDTKRDVGREPWRQRRITWTNPGLNGGVSAFIQPSAGKRRSTSLREWAHSCFKPRSISFEALALNWRGLLAARSAAAIRALGLSASFLILISSVTLERGMWIVNQFRHSTFTIRAWWGYRATRCDLLERSLAKWKLLTVTLKEWISSSLQGKVRTDSESDVVVVACE